MPAKRLHIPLSFFLAALGIVACTVIPAKSSYAATLPGSPATESPAGLVAGTKITLPGGRVVTLPKPWSDMSISDLANLGIEPGMGPKVSTSVAPAGRVAPGSAQSASGCNQEVCIILTGSGRKVTGWQTTGEYTGSSDAFCTYAVYWAPGNSVYATGITVCGGPGEYYGYYAEVPIVWSSNIELCNTWAGIPGKPCEEVHS